MPPRFSKPLIIGCTAVLNEFKQLRATLTFDYKTIDAGLHLRPEQLKQALQQAIDAADGRYATIILGFGLCSNAVLGLQTRYSTLVVPRVDDCIALFLGSRQRYRDEMRRRPGTYFLSRGWIDAGITLIEEYNAMVDRYGEERAGKLMRRLLVNYRQLAYIALDTDDQESYRLFAQRAAEQFGLAYAELKGDTALLEAMMSGNFGAAFSVIPPGRAAALEDFRPTPDAQRKSNP